MTEFVRCPDPFCCLDAEVMDRYEVASTSGPVRMVKTRCVVRHILDNEEPLDAA